ncbi:MAG: hypothetical protein NUV90_02770 [Candidatus Parcubacteria bacterium]|nr:hypothetical protein [Candidatus Parcubacteria bacterium]
MNTPGRTNGFLLHDILIIATSIAFAAIMVRTGIVAEILASTEGFRFVGSFIAGLFFTSIFTTAPAIVAFSEIAHVQALLPVALFGAAGAVVGDLIIFRFVRDKFSGHLLELFGQRHLGKRVRALFKLRLFRWVSLFVGGLIIASPFPDELGIGLFGFSKIRTAWFIPLSFIFNFAGIVLIGLIAQTV